MRKVGEKKNPTRRREQRRKHLEWIRKHVHVEPAPVKVTAGAKVEG